VANPHLIIFLFKIKKKNQFLEKKILKDGIEKCYKAFFFMKWKKLGQEMKSIKIVTTISNIKKK
jgi:hypothetical protein